MNAADSDLVRTLILQVRREIDAHEEYLKDIELDNIYESYAGEKSFFMVLTLNCRVIGTVGILPLSKMKNRGCELKKFYLDNAWRGLGLGMELIRSCLYKAREKGYQNCYLETDPLLQSAGNLYKRLGFKHVPENEYINLPPTRYNWHFKPLTESFTNV
ncbi:GNAT family N-acetyltransferase [Ulvibacterium sp.]|uniref:GNAT family N-acetyltransferase n=1 Tax=Ulvibacterium sp. TaxID=2665914 RepID=UPI003BACDB55